MQVNFLSCGILLVVSSVLFQIAPFVYHLSPRFSKPFLFDALEIKVVAENSVPVMESRVIFIAGLVAIAICFSVVSCDNDAKKLQIGIKKKVENCSRRSKSGDSLHMHYTGKLEDGTEFDSSIPRGQPFVFTLGAGQVIKGWDQGLLNMCVGEKRKLVIPAHMGYGDRGAPPKIPGGSTLIFEVELIKIEGKKEL